MIGLCPLLNQACKNEGCEWFIKSKCAVYVIADSLAKTDSHAKNLAGK